METNERVLDHGCPSHFLGFLVPVYTTFKGSCDVHRNTSISYIVHGKMLVGQGKACTTLDFNTKGRRKGRTHGTTRRKERRKLLSNAANIYQRLLSNLMQFSDIGIKREAPVAARSSWPKLEEIHSKPIPKLGYKHPNLGYKSPTP